MTEHQNMVRALKKDGALIKQEITPQQADLLHMAVGVSGEAGELLDAVKRVAIYQKPIDLDNVREELGDLEFFMEGLRQNLGITREQTLAANIEKLGKRYPAGHFRNEHAQERLDKA